MLKTLKYILQERCPRCHKGKLFTHKIYQLGHVVKMKERCPVCGQRTQLEPGFYFGTGYVSYALVVGFSIITFVTWSMITGYGFGDSQIFHWLIGDIIAMILLQPWFMRVSRMIWLTVFFHSDDHLHIENGGKGIHKNDRDTL